ncbi:uncharacterized protein Z519_05971 [Cladophialophora bantiana CBS 173.52]|uniref:ATP phosphoribosyltransferase n=1 Tax=Cladophialophora bantiana (strain ATCC 10958 / CBS 173.52 / CDC B-1940 / NIH 8579) TaxID=1442370 RepID=A0A0D2EU08_CLAB1|nr:uncharacterized protein Z519_05971 [Cladophialophora bantiana CBS 173.52]KIW93366.1 hypothetical protein Z519_05971 [Cladophialophora bantiana CBS 173.52]
MSSHTGATSTTTAATTSSTDDKTIYKLTFYVPPANTQACLSALWATGAGTWPNDDGGPALYTDTAFISRGTGQFKPSAAANPHIGAPGQVEYVEEDRVEMVVVGTQTCRTAVQVLRKAHPYEVVALFVARCEDF